MPSQHQRQHSRVKSLNSDSTVDHDPENGAGYSDEDSEHSSNHSPKKRKQGSGSVSCQLCKTRKVKCDRLSPSCGWCTRNNATCEYRARKKPGLRAGYGRELEMRLDKLERILVEHEEALRRVTLGQVDGRGGLVGGDGREGGGGRDGRARAGSERSSGETDSTLERDALVFPRIYKDEVRSPPLVLAWEREGTMSSASTIHSGSGIHQFSPPSTATSTIAPLAAVPQRPQAVPRRYSVGAYYQPPPAAVGVSLPPISNFTPGHDRRTSLEFINNPITAVSTTSRPRGWSLGTKRIMEEPEHGWREPPMMRSGSVNGATVASGNTVGYAANGSGGGEHQRFKFVYSTTSITPSLPTPMEMDEKDRRVEAR